MIIRMYGKWLVVLKGLYLKIIRKNLYGYCRSCGRRVHDFIVSDKLWKDVTGWKNGEGTLCYDCFCEMSDKKGIYFRGRCKRILK